MSEPQVIRYARWLARERGLHFDPTTVAGYDAMWRWSVGDLSAFWQSIWDYFEIQSPTPHQSVLADDKMPGAKWFAGARVNYAGHVFRHAQRAHAAGQPAIVFQNEPMRERGEMLELSWLELRRQVASLARHLRDLGVRPLDRVGGILPNTPQTAVAFLATASVGAIWSVCSPETGVQAITERFEQIEPKLLIVCDGYTNAGVSYDRRTALTDVLGSLPSVRDVVMLRYLHADSDPQALAGAHRRAHDFAALTVDDVPLEPAWLPFDHPLWIVYSSGTTGLPKPIVHGHGGIMLEALKTTVLHNDLGPTADTGDRYQWSSPTAWIMWNAQMSALLAGVTVCMYDGSVSGPRGRPDWSTLWRFAADSQATFFGAGAAVYASYLKAGLEPAKLADLSRLRAIGSTGSPLAPECYRWIYDSLPRPDGRDIWLAPISGGTDFAGAFLAGLRTLPVVEGEMQCRCLGAAVEAWGPPDAQGRGQPLMDEVGELVCTRPMPSMPLYLWGDPDGERYRESYFQMYPGTWRHGDWLRITPRGGAIIYGRSDATINRHGIRIGTSELYRAVEALPEVVNALVVDLEYLGQPSYMPMFVELRPGVTLDAALTQRIEQAIKTGVSARFIPDEVHQVSAIPFTRSLKKMELPVKNLLLGDPAEKVFKLDAMLNPEIVAWFTEFADQRRLRSRPR